MFSGLNSSKEASESTEINVCVNPSKDIGATCYFVFFRCHSIVYFTSPLGKVEAPP
jgi:hypothetical protein